jgi:hypothetical protein
MTMLHQLPLTAIYALVLLAELRHWTRKVAR